MKSDQSDRDSGELQPAKNKHNNYQKKTARVVKKKKKIIVNSHTPRTRSLGKIFKYNCS